MYYFVLLSYAICNYISIYLIEMCGMMVWVRELTWSARFVASCRCCKLWFGVECPLHAVVEVWSVVEELWPLVVVVVKRAW